MSTSIRARAAAIGLSVVVASFISGCRGDSQRQALLVRSAPATNGASASEAVSPPVPSAQANALRGVEPTPTTTKVVDLPPQVTTTSLPGSTVASVPPPAPGSAPVPPSGTPMTSTTSTTSPAQHCDAHSGPAPQPGQPPEPSISGVAPASGPARGGTTVTIKGDHLTGTTGVAFRQPGMQGYAATSYTVVSDTEITATTPAVPAPGYFCVNVATGGGTSQPSPGAVYNYT